MATHMIWFTLIRVIGWTLVHFLWQGTLLGLVYFSVRSILPRGTARYRFGMGILFALAACPLVTMWQLLDTVSLTSAAGQAPAMSLVVGEPVAGGAGHAVSGFDVLLPWLVLAWSIGVLLHSVRACMQWRALKMLVREAEQLPQWQQRIADMAGRFALHRRITVLGSRIISSPVLIGWIRPVILLPMAVVCGFPASQVELLCISIILWCGGYRGTSTTSAKSVATGWLWPWAAAVVGSLLRCWPNSVTCVCGRRAWCWRPMGACCWIACN